MKKIKKIAEYLWDLFEGEDDPNEVVYDPVHVAGVIVGSVTVFGILFWLLWCLFVFKGGIFVKIIPFFQVLFTSKTLNDFGYEGYPYEMGIFDGWYVNLIALFLSLGLLALVWWMYQQVRRLSNKEG